MKKLSSLLGVADMGFKRTLANFLHNQSIHFIHFDETLIMQYILPTSELADWNNIIKLSPQANKKDVNFDAWKRCSNVCDNTRLNSLKTW